jgi:hypothetical protein
LTQKILPFSHPYFNDKTRKALEYADRSATHLTISNPQEIIKAAHSSRIGHLFILRNESIWATFIESEMKITISDERENGDEDLLNKAVIKTILNGGEVHVLDKEDMPACATIAALLRY